MSGKIAMALTTAVLLSACNYETDLNLLQTVTNWNQVGDSPEQWLEQYSPGRSDWDKVALVFGFAADYDGCTDMANGLAQKFPDGRFRCVPAN